MYSVEQLSYEELISQLRTNFLDRIILRLSSTARYNASNVISDYEKVVKEGKLLNKSIELWDNELEELENCTLNRALSGPCEEGEIKMKHYTMSEYRAKIDLYKRVNKYKLELLESIKEHYTNYNALRLALSLYEAAMSKKTGVLYIWSKYKDRDTKYYESYAKKSDKDIIMFNEYGIDEFDTCLFSNEYIGIIIKTTTPVKEAISFLENNLSRKPISEVIVKIF